MSGPSPPICAPAISSQRSVNDRRCCSPELSLSPASRSLLGPPRGSVDRGRILSGRRLARFRLVTLDSLALPLERRADEPCEQRMNTMRPALELRMELAAHKVRMVPQLDHFDQALVGRSP